jgi:hypothetical protein
MKCYRFKHKPTGLYYRPSSEVLINIKNPNGTTKVRTWVKTNLSKKGKIYPMKPSWSWINGGYYNHILTKQKMIDENLDDNQAWKLRTKTSPFIQDDWELEEL